MKKFKTPQWILEIYWALKYDLPNNEWTFSFEKDYKKWEIYCGREYYDWWHYALLIGPIQICSFPAKGDRK